MGKIVIMFLGREGDVKQQNDIEEGRANNIQLLGRLGKEKGGGGTEGKAAPAL